MQRLALILIAACGAGSKPEPAVAAGPPAAMTASGEGDVSVATVGGRPVWGSCVAQQAARGRDKKMTRDQALHECIDFELLAQAAEARGFANDGEVIDATRTELVRRLIDAWNARYPTPDSLRDRIDEMWKQASPADLVQPATRDSFHVLVAFPKTMRDGKVDPDVDAKARAIADAIYPQLASQVGLFPAQLQEAVAKLQPDAKQAGLELVAQHVDPTSEDSPRLVPEYRSALFAIPEVGRVSPITRTQFGYHVILLTDVKPAQSIDYKMAEPRLFELLRRQMFQDYVAELGKSLNLTIEGPYFDRLAPPEPTP